MIAEEERQSRSRVSVRFVFDVHHDVPGIVQLALEDAEAIEISFDGQEVPSYVTGWWVDEDIQTVRLPSLKRGSHTLQLIYDFSIVTNVERAYLLGDFGVEIRGARASITPLEFSQITFGDYTSQGLPFYAGNVTYNCTFDTQGAGPAAVQVTRFASPVLSITCDGKEAGHIAYEPHMIVFEHLEEGQHAISITSFGNRANDFGMVHLPRGLTNWYGPSAWRTDYDWWTKEYNLVQMGVLETPRIKKPGTEKPTGRLGYRLELKAI
ncbi:hypothetical protein DACRYDRAFT_111285 [Dacryopinax primogenitus]|uniref:Uncharacterized protein n=1 Tax=Dacryopinax primogenitus (strain DJM 731) TaxID=1858805 RepID=M5G1Y0_DACPD|nr:uncharacterized protein DACRYDRAFT_111285 [Dacryopinax primogenitus]EJT97767.1 hypothetical protein DACRYDRAFT_111285 [Dacryopinax primogenitus]